MLRDTAKVMASASTADVHDAGERLVRAFHRPVLLVWSLEDQVFPVAHATRYAARLARAHVELIDDAYSFTPEDQPERLAAAIARFAAGDDVLLRQTA